MPAHSASEDARKRAYVAGIHVFLRSIETWMAGTSPAMTFVEKAAQSCLSSVSAPERSALPGASSMLSVLTTPLSTTIE